MEYLAEHNVLFLGQAVEYAGTAMTNTLKEIPKNKLLELPVTEELQMGISIGLSLNGITPISIYPRWNFLLLATNQIVNHLDKIEKMSLGEYKTPVIIRAVVGGRKPIDPGIQHTQDYTQSIRKMVSFPVIDLRNIQEIISEYNKALKLDSPILFVERRDLFDVM